MTTDPSQSSAGALGTYSYPVSTSRSTVDLLKDIVSNLQEMIRSEVKLARVEIRQDVMHSTGALKLIAMGGVLALFSGALLTVTLVLFLSFALPLWAATLLTGTVYGAAGATLVASGRGRFRMPVPDKMIENVKENVEWMKEQKKS